MGPKKNYFQLYYYASTVFIHITSSKFYYKNSNEILQLKKIRLHINRPRPNKTHFLYLLLLLNRKLPHMHNFYIPNKFRYQKQRIRRRHGMSVFLNKKNSYIFISKLLVEILPFSTSTENEAIKKIKNYWKLSVWQAPLTSETYRLQSLHGYVSNIPLTMSFHLTNPTTSQHLHFFNFFKIIDYESIIHLSQ